MVVEDADGPKAHDVRDFDSCAMGRWIDLGVHTRPSLQIESRAIFAVHRLVLSLVFAALAASLLATGFQRQPVPKAPVSKAPKIVFDGKVFVATVNGKTAKTSMSPVQTGRQASTPKTLYRKDDAFVVWDARGLSIRKKDKVVVTRLSGATTSEALWGRLKSAQNRVLIDVGGYASAAHELVDHRRIASEVLMLYRWRRPNGDVWFDALIAIDLDAKSPGVQLVGRYDEVSEVPGRGALLLSDSDVCLVERQESQWNLVRLQRKVAKTSKTEFPGRLLTLDHLGGKSIGFVSRSDYETQSAGRLSWATGRISTIAEAKGAIGFLPGAGATVAWIRDAEGLWLNDVESGSKLKVDPAARFRRIGENVVVWTEKSGPNEATLYQPNRWLRLAHWVRPAGKSPKPPN